MSRFAALFAALTLFAALPARGQEARFTFTPTDNGFMRLDAKTGGVSVCARAGAGFACKAAQDDRAGADDDFQRLARENDSLKARVAELEKRAAAPAAAPAPAAVLVKPPALLPGRAEFSLALDGLAKAWLKLSGQWPPPKP